jgi:hypothetical protein
MACASSVTWGQYADGLRGEVGQAYADFVLGGASVTLPSEPNTASLIALSTPDPAERTLMNIIRAVALFAASLFSMNTSAKAPLPGFQLPKADSEYDEKVLADIKKIGWHHVHVRAEDGEPSFAYSLGFYANFGQPEIIVFGLPPQIAQQLLNIAAIRFAGAKTAYETYKPYDDIAEGMRIAFIPVDRRHYREYLGYAGWFYASIKADFPALQMVWPDKQGRFPWEPNYDQSFSRLQLLLDK